MVLRSILFLIKDVVREPGPMFEGVEGVDGVDGVEGVEGPDAYKWALRLVGVGCCEEFFVEEDVLEWFPRGPINLDGSVGVKEVVVGTGRGSAFGFSQEDTPVLLLYQ